MLDQHAIAGLGNLLVDQILWQARVNPARRVDRLSAEERTRIMRAERRAVRTALERGGVHELSLLPYRRPDAACPRDGAPMRRSTVGGRTSYWCSREQPIR